ncbi:MAG: hypothetical protein ABFC24_03160 [Methanoregulaceae archaeon]
MARCFHCGKESPHLKRCQLCGEEFCPDCILPPDHICTVLKKWHQEENSRNNPVPNQAFEGLAPQESTYVIGEGSKLRIQPKRQLFGPERRKSHFTIINAILFSIAALLLGYLFLLLPFPLMPPTSKIFTMIATGGIFAIYFMYTINCWMTGRKNAAFAMIVIPAFVYFLSEYAIPDDGPGTLVIVFYFSIYALVAILALATGSLVKKKWMQISLIVDDISVMQYTKKDSFNYPRKWHMVIATVLVTLFVLIAGAI